MPFPNWFLVCKWTRSFPCFAGIKTTTWAFTISTAATATKYHKRGDTISQNARTNRVADVTTRSADGAAARTRRRERADAGAERRAAERDGVEAGGVTRRRARHGDAAGRAAGAAAASGVTRRQGAFPARGARFQRQCNKCKRPPGWPGSFQDIEQLTCACVLVGISVEISLEVYAMHTIS